MDGAADLTDTCWSIRSDILQALKSDRGYWTGVLSGDDLPLGVHIDDVAQPVVTCHALRNRGAVVAR